MQQKTNQIFLLYSPYYAEACNELRSVYTERDSGFAVFAKEWSKLNKVKSFIQNATAEHDLICFT